MATTKEELLVLGIILYVNLACSDQETDEYPLRG